MRSFVIYIESYFSVFLSLSLSLSGRGAGIVLSVQKDGRGNVHPLLYCRRGNALTLPKIGGGGIVLPTWFEQGGGGKCPGGGGMSGYPLWIIFQEMANWSYFSKKTGLEISCKLCLPCRQFAWNVTSCFLGFFCFIFPRKQDLRFHANWFLFSGKNKKIFQNVVCWKF